MKKGYMILLEVGFIISLCVIGAYSFYFFGNAVYKNIVSNYNDSHKKHIQTGPSMLVGETQKTTHKVENIHFPFRTNEGLEIEINFDIYRSIETTRYDRAEITRLVMDYFYKYSWEEISKNLEFHSDNIEKEVKEILGNNTTIANMTFLSNRPF